MKQRIAAIIVLVVCTFIVWNGAALAYPGHGETSQKIAILLVTFGSSYPEAQKAFDTIDERVRNAFPDKEIRWAYTSRMIRNKMAGEGMDILSPEQALAQLADDGFTKVAVQSLHVIMGSEYHYLVSVARAFESMGKGFDVISVGMPLLAGQGAMDRSVAAVKAIIPPERNTDEAVVLVGHGSAHPANASYAALMWQLQVDDPNIHIGAISAFPEMEDILERLKANEISKVWLMPFMSVAGDHSQNDIFGDDDDSWQSVFTEAGIEVDAVKKGVAEYDVFVDVWIEHLKEALSKLQGAKEA